MTKLTTRRRKRRGPGRPSLGKAARSKLIQIKVTEAELAQVKDRADAHKLSVSEYARRRILS